MSLMYANGTLVRPPPPPGPSLPRRRSQAGSIAIMFSGALFLFFALLGFSWDLSRAYNRKIEVQQLANAAALAAAHELNGTAAGITNAKNKASASVRRLAYNYSTLAPWSDDAISFSDSLTGEWVTLDVATSNPQGVKFVKIDTTALGYAVSHVYTIFMNVVSPSASLNMSATAIAGPSQLAAVPFGICAMSPNAATARLNPGSATPSPAPPNTELVEYGFRRGVGYDLMNLNPNGTTAQNFMISPISGVMDEATVGAFICTGSMVARGIVNKSVTVARGFPIADLYKHFNSRFDSYPAGACSPNSAPPDANVKAYDRSVAGAVPWMSPVPGTQSARSLASGGELWTVADPLPAPSSNTAGDYGVLWSYAKAVPYSSYVPGAMEPSGGYVPFGVSDWKTLYDPGRPAATASYPTSSSAPTPYWATSGANFQAPPTASHRPGIRNRRLLYVPLLECPVPGSTAKVLAIGRFFMTAPATSTSLYAEFAGIASENTMGTQMELYQ